MIITSILLLVVILPLFIMPVVKRNAELKRIVEHKEWVSSSHERYMIKQVVQPAVEVRPKKLSPRQNEQFWIKIWLDNWYRQVGSKYVPLEGDADWVNPVQQTDSKVVQAMSVPTAKIEYLDMNELVEKPVERKEGMQPVRELPASSETVNNNFDYLMNVVDDRRYEEYKLRYKLDPIGRLTDHQWKKLHETLVAYEKRQAEEKARYYRNHESPYLLHMEEERRIRERQRQEIEGMALAALTRYYATYT